MSRPKGHTIKYAGITKPVAKIAPVRGSKNRTILTAGKQPDRKARAALERQAIVDALAPAVREAVHAMDIDTGHSVNLGLSPGDDGFDPGADMGDYTDLQNLLSSVQMCAQPSYDPRTRRDRQSIGVFHWDLQIERLTDAYLDFSQRFPDHAPFELPTVKPALGTFELWDISSRKTVAISPAIGHHYLNETFLSFGYLASCPLLPTIAFSIRALNIYRQVHRTCPRVSINAYCRSLCNLNNVPFSPYLSVQFSDAYDGYLFIHRVIDRRVDVALGHDAPYWHVKNSCPACFYTLDAEPDLPFSFFVAMDGNNSLRRLGAAKHSANRVEHVETRTIASDWWIPPEEVDKFKDEVQSSPTHGSDIPTNEQLSGEAVEAELSLPSSKCRDRWKNAGPEERKRMITLFDETGVFITSCRHRFVLFGCDMIKSGELYKYAFASVNRVLTILEPRAGCAYDVGCEFSSSLDRSTLAALVASTHFRMMCGAFHGYAHNRACQLDWHPLYKLGTGNFDGEGCEHIFSSSNDIARATRHASKFHRRQAIEEHFKFWNEDKYAVLSTYIVNHYNEAVKRIHAHSLELALLNKELKLTAQDFEADLVAERAYFTELASKETLETCLEANYVQALRDLHDHTLEWEDARSKANHALSAVGLPNPLTAVQNTREIVDAAYQRLQVSQTTVSFLEAALKISTRWSATHPDYIRYHQENIATNYRKVVTELERLVVLRFTELTKMSVPGLGYKLRRHISKALVRRNEAIRKAIERYNTQAARLDPPRDALTWKQIADTAFLGNFDVLKDIGLNVDTYPWTSPKRRTAATAYFKICRSQEEITRLNVEIRRLLTSIADEKTATLDVIATLKTTNPALASEVNQRWLLHSKINQRHVDQLNALSKLPGFTGSLQTGQRRQESSPAALVSQPPIATNSTEPSQHVATPFAPLPLVPQPTVETNDAESSQHAIAASLSSVTPLVTGLEEPRHMPQVHNEDRGVASQLGSEGREDNDWEDINELIEDLPTDSVDLLSDFLAAM